MNNNTKAAYKQTSRKSRSVAFKQSNKRNRWNITGKVAGKPSTQPEK